MPLDDRAGTPSPRADRPRDPFAHAGSVDIAYQTFGSGDTAVVWVPGWMSHVEAMWDLPDVRPVLERLGSFSRVVTFDKRGTGMSDRMGSSATLEELDDVRSVMDAAGVKRAVLFGWADAGAMLALFAATYPDRVRGTHRRRADGGAEGDNPWGIRPEFLAATHTATAPDVWGSGSMLTLVDPSAAPDGHVAAWWRRYEVLASTPSAVATMVGIVGGVDVRLLLASVQAPTLATIATCSSSCLEPRHFADQITHAESRELPGDSITGLPRRSGLGDEGDRPGRATAPIPTPCSELAEIARPTIGDDEVLVRVAAASVDMGTWHCMTGLPYAMRLAGFGVRAPEGVQPGPGLAGTVESVGKDVTEFEPGDEVYGTCDGSFAEYAPRRAEHARAEAGEPLLRAGRGGRRSRASPRSRPSARRRCSRARRC